MTAKNLLKFKHFIFRASLFFLFPVAIITIITGCNKESDTDDSYLLEFITEEYKPLNYTENGSLKGLGPDLLKEICIDLGISYSSEVLSWDKAYAKALTNEHAVLYSTILNAERKSLFKWAGPYASLDWNFYSSSQNPIELTSLDEARNVAGIGVLSDYSITQYLISEGFSNLIYCENNQDAFSKLLSGEITLFPSDKITAEAALTAIGKSIYDVTNKLSFRTDLVYFAFNNAVPDRVVENFQKEIDESKQNGVLKKLYQMYMQSANPPDIIQVYTEQYPPLTYRNNMGDITGFGTDVVLDIMKRNQSYYPIRVTLWSNAYELALLNPNFCLFTMDRTEQRENLFQWVGPIGSNVTYFYVRADSGITIKSINDARALNSVGTVSSWFSDQYLRGLGFTNLVTGNDPGLMTSKLINGEIDAFVCTNITFPSILRSMNYQYNQVEPAFQLMSSDFYIAFSKDTPTGTVLKWQQALDAARQDGTYDAIYRKWFN
ncbi:MAG: transporter substrate-binding domain-containing protein [Bacteroidales bacterium]|jgi:polar amino acid transport system substrate-binding protein|nr:transporter substrate-binding domain-containing protein [Bacteroidales bacterium]HPM11559.1 transporter substrate-binding domain-containing protein [Paludibacter sp.]